MRPNRLVVGVAAFGVIVAGCGAQPEPPAPSSTPSSVAATPKVPSLIDARFMGLGTSRLWNWELLDRQVAKNFQEFGVRPIDETELPRGCNGCGEYPATAVMKVYAAGAFDPAEARSGQPVSVNGGEGFFRPAAGTESAELAWQYADNAWATTRGTTTATSGIDRLVQLAADFRPAARSVIPLPLSLTTMPEAMPLASIREQSGRWPTLIDFGKCQHAAPDCTDDADAMHIAIWPADGYAGHIDENGAVPITIGGKDGLFNEGRNEAAVQVKPGMLVSFELSGPAKPPTTDLKDILTGVEWAPDPGNEQTWPVVTDWSTN